MYVYVNVALPSVGSPNSMILCVLYSIAQQCFDVALMVLSIHSEYSLLLCSNILLLITTCNGRREVQLLSKLVSAAADNH